MKYILTINYNKFVLPSETNLDVVMKALGKCVEYEWDKKTHKRVFYPAVSQPEITLESVEDLQVVDQKPVD